MAVETTIRDAVATIRIARPDVMNAIEPALLDELGAAIASAAEQGAKAAVLTGSESAFCAGADLDYVGAAFAGDTAGMLGPLVDSLHGLIAQMREAPYPIVAALEGPAVGAGMGLALACDVRVAGRSAYLLGGYLAIGASPDGGVSYFLTRAVGAARVSSALLRNRPLRSAQLEAWGLVEEIVDDGAALPAAQALAAQLTTTPPLALVRLRRLVDEATTHGLGAHLDTERAAVAGLWPTNDFREGVGAFLERRTPTFTGS